MILTHPFALIVGHHPDTPAEFIGTFGAESEAMDEGRRIAESRVAGHTRNALNPPCFEVFDLRHPGPVKGGKIFFSGGYKPCWPPSQTEEQVPEQIREAMAEAMRRWGFVDSNGAGSGDGSGSACRGNCSSRTRKRAPRPTGCASEEKA